MLMPQTAVNIMFSHWFALIALRLNACLSLSRWPRRPAYWVWRAGTLMPCHYWIF